MKIFREADTPGKRWNAPSGVSRVLRGCLWKRTDSDHTEGSQQWHAECLHRGHSIDETVDSQPAYSLFFDNTNILVHCLTLWHTLLYPPLTPINPRTHHWSPPHINILSCYPLFSFLTLIFGHFFLSLENFFVSIPTRSTLPNWRFFGDPAPPLSMVWPEALDNM